MESNSSVSSRLMWLMSGFSAGIVSLVHHRTAGRIGDEIQSFRNLIQRHHPQYIEQSEAVLTKLGELATAIEDLLDAID